MRGTLAGFHSLWNKFSYAFLSWTNDLIGFAHIRARKNSLYWLESNTMIIPCRMHENCHFLFAFQAGRRQVISGGVMGQLQKTKFRRLDKSLIECQLLNEDFPLHLIREGGEKHSELYKTDHYISCQSPLGFISLFVFFFLLLSFRIVF